MVKTYHTLQQWNQWLTKFPGSSVLETEKKLLSSLLKKLNGEYSLVIGVPEQYHLIKDSPFYHNVVLSPLINNHPSIKYVECGLSNLSILPGSVDVVILPHVLEFVDSPRHLLTEACRTVKPNGTIIIIGFNPISFWGLKKWWGKNQGIPWSGRFIFPKSIIKWLDLEEFEFIRKDMIMFKSPKENSSHQFSLLEWLGNKTSAFFGGVYAISAQAKVIPLTPIKLHWVQSLPHLSATIPGPSSIREIQ